MPPLRKFTLPSGLKYGLRFGEPRCHCQVFTPWCATIVSNSSTLPGVMVIVWVPNEVLRATPCLKYDQSAEGAAAFVRVSHFERPSDAVKPCLLTVAWSPELASDWGCLALDWAAPSSWVTNAGTTRAGWRTALARRISPVRARPATNASSARGARALQSRRFR